LALARNCQERPREVPSHSSPGTEDVWLLVVETHRQDKFKRKNDFQCWCLGTSRGLICVSCLPFKQQWLMEKIRANMVGPTLNDCFMVTRCLGWQMPSFQACCAHDHDCEAADCGPAWSLHQHINLQLVCPSLSQVGVFFPTSASLLPLDLIFHSIGRILV
jgi:hypothetical protein